MSDDIPENKMTELERKIIYERMEDIEDEDKLVSVEEALERIETDE